MATPAAIDTTRPRQLAETSPGSSTGSLWDALLSTADPSGQLHIRMHRLAADGTKLCSLPSLNYAAGKKLNTAHALKSTCRAFALGFLVFAQLPPQTARTMGSGALGVLSRQGACHARPKRPKADLDRHTHGASPTARDRELSSDCELIGVS